MDNSIREYEYDLSGATWHKSSYSGGQGGDCLEVATWRKSSYSGGSGGDCLEVADTWRKSTHSGGEGGDCLEVADGHPQIVPVRDSKNPTGATLVFRNTSWSAFIADVKAR
ncbi:DUF397 domain-containing protein [Streptomyces alboniger]|uniref:DUF397 domain-containing protein n=1 Tax=Streptomyces alboniger TaxID=132473 RepID=A0A5J6HHP8_STRAD|nr:DUF397 domain-containing protein [Streptomyces alboniger]QEV18762.1 DUF397 domain-containing protein [Streptomyces alboniger]